MADNLLPDTTGPRIVESYRDFKPPRGFKKKVELLLRYVPPKYLAGLDAIVLTNGAALNRDERPKKTWSRNRKVQTSKCLGLYRGKTRSTPASVWLYVDNIKKAGMGPLDGVPVFTLRSGTCCITKSATVSTRFIARKTRRKRTSRTIGVAVCSRTSSASGFGTSSHY